MRILAGASVRECDFNKVEMALLRGCSPVGLLRVCRASFFENTSEGLLLNIDNFRYDF